MSVSQESIDEVKAIIEKAKKIKDESDNATPDILDKENVNISRQNDILRNKTENILSRFQAGAITREAAQSQIREALMNRGAELIAELMRYKKLSSDFSVTEKDIEEAMLEVERRFPKHG